MADSERRGSWEILPHEVKKGEVVLSKRNELGVFSNLAHSPFNMDGVKYSSVEALWQMMKYPDLSDTNDIRISFSNEFPFMREEVYQMSGFESKKAGDLANRINKEYGLTNIVCYKKNCFDYKDHQEGSRKHLELIKKAIYLKVYSNPNIFNLLMKTKGLKLRPDHLQGQNRPKSYFYHEILMEIRDNV